MGLWGIDYVNGLSRETIRNFEFDFPVPKGIVSCLCYTNAL